MQKKSKNCTIFLLIVWVLVLNTNFKCWEDPGGNPHQLLTEIKLLAWGVRAGTEVWNGEREEGWETTGGFSDAGSTNIILIMILASKQFKTRHPLAGLVLSWINNLILKFNPNNCTLCSCGTYLSFWHLWSKFYIIFYLFIRLVPISIVFGS